MNKKVIGLGLVILFVCIIGIPVWATGAKEARASVQDDFWLSGDPTSNDIIRQKGLPRLEDKAVEVDLMTIWVSGKSAEKEKLWVEENFRNDYPMITTNLERLGTNPLKEAATIRVIAGTPPTIAHISGGYAIDEFIKQGVLQDVTKYWEYYELESLVNPTLASAFKFDGKFYGFPFSDAPQALLFWDKTVFAQAGVPEPPYADWDEFFSAAEKWKAVKPNVPFYASSLNPGWYGFERALVQAASRFGKDFIFRIYNGEASLQDFVELLTFNKKLLSVSNTDFASLEGTQGVHEIVLRGDAALCYSGSWGLAAFEKAGVRENEKLGYSLLPGNNMHFSTISGFIVFAKSGKEAAGEALAVHSMLTETQTMLNLSKDNIPARLDIKLESTDGWKNLVKYIADQLDSIEIIPRANTGLSSKILNDMTPIYTSAMTGVLTITNAATQMKSIQDSNQQNFQFIRW